MYVSVNKVLYLTGGSGNTVHPETIDSMQRVLRHWLSAIGVVKDVLPPSVRLSLKGSCQKFVLSTEGSFTSCNGGAGSSGRDIARNHSTCGGWRDFRSVRAPYDGLIPVLESIPSSIHMN